MHPLRLSRLHQTAKQRKHLRVVLDQILRMPLDTEGKRMIDHLNGLNKAIRGVAHGAQAVCQILNSLMVQAVDFCLPAVQRRR